MLLQKYENFIQELNSKINNGSFDIETNKEKLETIIGIYKELKAKNYDTAKILISSLNIDEKEKSNIWEELVEEYWQRPSWSCHDIPRMPAPQNSEWFAYKKLASINRDWNIESIHDEDNIEAFNSIEMMSAIFLQNIKDKIWAQK